MSINKYISLSNLSMFLDNIKDKFAASSHTHKISDITGLEDIGIATSDVEPAYNDVPKVYISGTIPESKDEVLAELVYISKTDSFRSYIKIKCQGNSSMAYNKKNFTIKMYEDEDRKVKLKKNIKGWGDNNKFVLKANWIDYSHARNIVSARLWSRMVAARPDYNTLPEELRTSPNNGAVDGFPVFVYCNGIYWGRYTWNLAKDDLQGYMEKASHIHRLRKHGMDDVFDYTFQLDTCNVVPGLEQKKIINVMQ
jgi:hypothetical protein